MRYAKPVVWNAWLREVLRDAIDSLDGEGEAERGVRSIIGRVKDFS